MVSQEKLTQWLNKQILLTKRLKLFMLFNMVISVIAMVWFGLPIIYFAFLFFMALFSGTANWTDFIMPLTGFTPRGSAWMISPWFYFLLYIIFSRLWIFSITNWTKKPIEITQNKMLLSILNLIITIFLLIFSISSVFQLF